MNKALGIRFVLISVLAVFLSACTKIDPAGPVRQAPDTRSVSDAALKRGYYLDGDAIVLNEATATDNPVIVVILPEGFTKEDLAVDGVFERKARQACEAMFLLEPMKSLRQYVEVDAAFYASRDRGISTSSKKADTYFSASLGAGVTDYGFDRVMADRCLALVDGNVYNKTGLIIANHRNNGAITKSIVNSNGTMSSVCIVPAETESAAVFNGLIWHECCGHAIGALADEYVMNDGHISSEAEGYIRMAQSYGFNRNVSFSSTGTEWDGLKGRDGYECVSCFEGASLWEKGVFRSEETSVMRDVTVPYFNAVSRESIYGRVMTMTGNPWSREEFLRLDRNWK